MGKHKKRQLYYARDESGEPSENKLIKFLDDNKFLLAVALLSLIPLAWFYPWDTLITGGDFWLPVGTVDTLRQMFGSWLANTSGGQPNGMLIFPWVVFFAFFKLLNFSLSSTEKLWFVSAFLTGGLSVYFLTKEVFLNKKDSWKNFLPAALYLFNVYIMMAGVVTTSLVSYTLLPLLLLIYIRGLKSVRPLKPAIAFGLASTFLASAAANPPIYSIPFLVMLLFFIYQLLFKRGRAISWKFNALAAFFYLLFNLWWLGLLAKTLIGQLSLIKGITTAAIPGVGSNIFDNIRLLGSWAFFAKYLDAPYFPFAQSYLNPVLAALTFLIPILALLGLVFGKRAKGSLLFFFGLLGLLGIFLSHGQAPDWLGRANAFFMETVPFFWIYREPYAKFTVLTALAYSVLLGGLFDFLEGKFNNRIFVNLAGAVVFVVILTVAWPITIGQHFPDARGVLAPLRTSIPSYWFDLANFFRGKENEGRVFISPDNPDYLRSGIPYSWGYDSADVTPFLLPVSWVERNNGYYGLPVLADKVSSLAYRTLHDDYLFPKNINSVLSVLNVSRIVQRNDIGLNRLTPPIEKYTPQYLKNALSLQDDLSLERSFGQLDVYKVKSEKYLDKLYLPQNIICITGDSGRLDFPLSLEAPELKKAIFSGSPEFCRSTYVNAVETFPLLGSETFESLSYNSDFLGQTGRFIFDSGFGNISKDSQNNKYFGFNINEAGVYEGTLFTDKFSKKQQFVPEFSLFSTTGPVLEAKGQASSRDPDLYDLGNLSLAPGKYLLALKQPSFSGVTPFNPSDWQSSLTSLPVQASDSSLSGRMVVSLGSGQMDAYLPLALKSFDIAYDVSFDYKVSGSVPPSFFYWENGCEANKPIWVKYDKGSDNSCQSNFPVVRRLETSSRWKSFNAEFRPSGLAKSQGIGLVFIRDDGLVRVNDGQTSITNVVVRPKFYGGVTFKKSGGDLAAAGGDLSILKRGRTEYTVGLKDSAAPQVLVFSETYSPDWKAEVKTAAGTTKLSQKDHYIVNGYANAWAVNAQGESEVKITYSPEKWFRLSFAVSAISVVVSLLYLAKPFIMKILRRRAFKLR